MIAVMLVYMALAQPAEARDPRVRAEFMRLRPCPATGRTHGACPGWQADHREALCSGGADRPFNMQWLTIEQHRIKTRGDDARCRAMRRR